MAYSLSRFARRPRSTSKGIQPPHSLTDAASEEAPSGNGVKPSAQVEEEFVLGVIQ